MKHSLDSKKGLSLSQAQTISNMCNQRAVDIEAQIDNINNAAKSFSISGKDYVKQQANKIPANIVTILEEKGSLHACQAFLMENIKAKDALLKAEQSKVFRTELKEPEYPELKNSALLKFVDETWGWDQLTVPEYNEYLDVTAKAAHIGQFIHNNGKLSQLRKELPKMELVEWMEINKGEKHPIEVLTHHTQEELFSLYEDLAKKHRELEQRVNYFKAKVKNAVTDKNAEISNENAKTARLDQEYNTPLENEYNKAMNEYNSKVKEESELFNAEKMNNIKEISKMRINIDPRFQDVINKFMPKESDSSAE